MQNGVPLKDAARQLGKSEATLRRWIQRGAPTVSLGSCGRGKGSTVDPEALRRWKTGGGAGPDRKDLPETIATALWDTLRRDEVHLRIGVAEGQAAGLLALAFERIWKNLTHEPIDTQRLPDKIAQLCAVYVESEQC